MHKVIDAPPPAPDQPPPLLALLKASRDELRAMQLRCGQLAELHDSAIARIENPATRSVTSDPPISIRMDLVAPAPGHEQAQKHVHQPPGVKP